VWYDWCKWLPPDVGEDIPVAVVGLPSLLPPGEGVSAATAKGS
jgi:hypothetical protein